MTDTELDQKIKDLLSHNTMKESLVGAIGSQREVTVFGS